VSITHHQAWGRIAASCAEAQTDVYSIKVTYRDSKGNDIKTVEGNEGDDLLILAHEYDIDLEGEIRVSNCSFLVPSCAGS
jgi:hypothetical protein